MTKASDKMKKVTVNLPESLVEAVLKYSDEGLTAIIRRQMERERRQLAWKEFAKLRGKIEFSQTYEEIKEARK